ncbi:MAG: sugar phosphate isomerase/epimerase [Kiritimatiellae bacterium]|nr:sugar phosphate isomerase/epimerase [Kiritimatiellia bacterium]
MSVSRRSFLKAGLAGLTVSALPALAATAKPQVGVQLYSVRGIAGKDLAGTFKALKAMGYAGVEFAGYYGKSAKELRTILDDCGLKVCGTHIGLDQLNAANLNKTIEFAQEIGNFSMAVSWLNAGKAEEWLGFAKILNAAAEKAKGLGMSVGYHNHQHEFKDKIDGKCKFELFFDALSPDVSMQMDVGHVVSAGADPLYWLGRYPKHSVVTCHAKETYPGPGILGQVKEGSKGVDWDTFFPAVEKKGLKWYIVESEADPNTLDRVKGCIEFLKAKGRC